MLTTFFQNVTFQDILDSMKTLGFLTGIACSFLMVLLLVIIDLWRMARRRRSLLTISMDNQGSQFKLSLKAIKTHLRCYLAQFYPDLTLQKIRLRRKGKGVWATVTVMADCGLEMHQLSEIIMSDLQGSLNKIMGMTDLFTRVDVVVDGLKDRGGVRFKRDAEPSGGSSAPTTDLSDDTPEGTLPPLQSMKSDEEFSLEQK